MKSPMIVHATYLTEGEKSRYSDMQVLRSAAGWYVGTVYTEDGVEERGSRDSGYYQTRAEAERHLNAMAMLGEDTALMLLRMEP